MSVETSEFFSQGRISFPASKALAFSFRSIRIRLGRMIIVLIGVASAIAFMTMLFSMATFTASAPSTADAAAAALAEEAFLLAEETSPVAVMERLSADTIDSSAVARAFRPWWLVIAIAISTAGITNAILMSVTERIKEIGTLKCLGAMSYHIVEIFLFESVFIGFIGGLVGALTGIGLAVGNLLLSGAEEAGMQIPPAGQILGTFAAGVLFSVAICLVASIVPVVVAARIQPADAMRYEV